MNILVILIVPAICLIAGIAGKLRPARNINSLIGYRSGRSRASQENWDKAQVLMANNLLIIGAAELVITLIVYAVTQNLPDDQTSILTIVLVALQTLGVVLVIPLVESKLS